MSQGISNSNRVAFYPPFRVDPNVPGRVYWGTDRIYRSETWGTNFVAISPDLTKDLEERSSCVSNFAVSPTDPNGLLVGTSDGYVQLTTNGGATWQNVTGVPLPNRLVSDAVWGPVTTTLYVTYASFSANTPMTRGHVFRNLDGGLS